MVARCLPLTLVFIALGCGSSPASSPLGPERPDCVTQCSADDLQKARQFCGTDGHTYGGCDWACSQMPTSVKVYPGACQSDGSPPTDAPAAPADGTEICDWVKIGGDWIAVECANEFDDLASVPSNEFGAPLGMGSVGGVAPPSMVGDVDHRPRFVGVRNQGGAASCTTFAAVAALESAVSAAAGEKTPLAEMHLWARYFKPDGGAMAQAIAKGGLVSAQTAAQMGFPYDDKTALSWEQGKSMPDAAALAKLDQMGLFEIAILQPLPVDPQTMKPSVAMVKQGIAEGVDIFAGINVGPEFFMVDQSGVVKEYAGSAQSMGHAVLLAGYRTINGQTYYIVRNSYGTSWGDMGYGYLSEKTLTENLRFAVAMGVRRNSSVTVQNCADGQAAGLDGTCRMRCADGSLATANGVCSDVPVTCAAGQTADSSGVCVSACKTGMSSGDGFTADCTERGCTYTINDGALGCAAGAGMTCKRFCAAPTCQAATAMNEFKMTVTSCQLPAM
jgi:hypothetical protein